jgi:hypothetical protein
VDNQWDHRKTAKAVKATIIEFDEAQGPEPGRGYFAQYLIYFTQHHLRAERVALHNFNKCLLVKMPINYQDCLWKSTLESRRSILA